MRPLHFQFVEAVRGCEELPHGDFVKPDRLCDEIRSEHVAARNHDQALFNPVDVAAQFDMALPLGGGQLLRVIIAKRRERPRPVSRLKANGLRNVVGMRQKPIGPGDLETRSAAPSRTARGSIRSPSRPLAIAFSWTSKVDGPFHRARKAAMGALIIQKPYFFRILRNPSRQRPPGPAVPCA